MTDKTPERQLNWAHSVLMDRGHTEKTKRKAIAIISKYDPEAFAEYDGDPVRTRGMFHDD